MPRSLKLAILLLVSAFLFYLYSHQINSVWQRSIRKPLQDFTTEWTSKFEQSREILSKEVHLHLASHTATLTPIPLPTATLTPLPSPTLTEIPIVTSSATPFAYVFLGKVTATSLNLRSGPGINHKIIGGFDRDDLVTILQEDSEKGWYYVQSEDGQKGWVSANYIEILAIVEVDLVNWNETPSPTPSATQTPLPSPSLPNLLAYAKKATAQIGVEYLNEEGKSVGKLGTAAIVHQDPFIVATSFHLVGDTKTSQWYAIQSIYLPDMDFTENGWIGRAYPQVDIAVILFPNTPEGEFTVFPVNLGTPQKGEIVSALGYPGFGGGDFIIGTGKVLEVNSHHIISLAATGPGSSGGPLINSQGELIGITVEIFPSGESNATRIHLVQKLINEVITDYQKIQTR